MFKRAKRIFVVLLLLTFAASAYVAWSGLTGRELPAPVRDALGAGAVVGTDKGFRDLSVTQGDVGWFAGTIMIENSGDTFQDVHVTVELFDGDQNVGTLMGSVALKPGKASSAELISTDDYVSWTDAHVELFRS